MKYYQPSLYSDDGTNIDYGFPEELHSFEVFETEDDCNYFMQEVCGYEEGSYIVTEFEDDDIEEPTFLDRHGNRID